MAKNQTRAEKVRTLEKRIEDLGRQMDFEKFLLSQKEDNLEIVFQETRICSLKAEMLNTKAWLEQLRKLKGLFKTVTE